MCQLYDSAGQCEIEDVVWYNDEPIASTSIVAQSKLFKKISSEKYRRKSQF